MSLYNRNSEFNANFSDLGEHESEISQSALGSFIRRTYTLLTASMLAASAGAYVAMQTGVFLSVHPLLYFVLMIGMIFGMQMAVNRGLESIALVMLFGFTFITGMTAGKVIVMYISMGAGSVVTQAFLLTAVTFGALTAYAMNTKTDFRSFGKPLFYVLIAVIVFGLINVIFVHSPIVSLAISAVCAVLFSFYIVYDTQNIINGEYDSPIMAAVSMYLNIYNLFMSLLRILGFANSND